MVINPSLIVKDETTDKGREIIIERHNAIENRDTKLGDVFDFLPSGLVYKDETGLGATTLELNSQRNSIIVEPIKITASSKAWHHNALYVGSETKYHKVPVYKPAILKYLNKETTTPKKIVVVADSLQRLIWAMMDAGKLGDYFLLIDEIDSFQLDSSYRSSMELCLDIYKTFDSDKRAMVSATSLDFSDPVLSKEAKTYMRYNRPTSRTIDLIFSSHKIAGTGVKRIAHILKQHPNDKILVAFNSVTGCFSMAKYLNTHYNVANKDIKILCSSNSKEKVGEYFTELDSKELPGKVNFITSAYFTGFDLSERYHLVSISGNTNRIYSLSEKRLKQIAGRCRDKKGLLSESIIYDLVPKEEKAEITSIDDLLKMAEREIAALECIDNNYFQHPLLKRTIKNVRELIVQNTTSHGYQFVRLVNQKPQISYLSLDAYRESVRVRDELYRDVNALPEALRKQGHHVRERWIKSDVMVETSAIEKKSRSEQMNWVIEKIRELPPFISPWQIREVYQKQMTPFQIDVVRKYEELYQFIQRDKLLELMQEAGEQRDSRMVNSLLAGAYFLTLDPQSYYKRFVNYHIPLGGTFTSEQLLEKWNTIFLESGLLKKFDTSVQAVRWTKVHYKLVRKKGAVDAHIIKEDNPFELTLLNHRPYKEGQKEEYSPLLFQGYFPA